MTTATLKGQTALITGASSGIGKACAETLSANGANVVITARRVDRLETMAKELSSKYGITVTPIALDVQDSSQVAQTVEELEKKGIAIDILVNNAGLSLGTDLIQSGKIADWETVIDTNIKGLLYMVRATLPFMLKRNRGHIVNIGSTAGHDCYRGGSVYASTKHAVRALSQSIRLDVMESAIRVSEIDPGCVHTEFSEVRWKDKAKADQFYQGFEPLVAQDIAEAILFCLTRPPHVNISEIIIFPQAQPSLNQIYRKGHSSPGSLLGDSRSPR